MATLGIIKERTALQIKRISAALGVPMPPRTNAPHPAEWQQLQLLTAIADTLDPRGNSGFRPELAATPAPAGDPATRTGTEPPAPHLAAATALVGPNSEVAL
jgi:hypothetical protein